MPRIGNRCVLIAFVFLSLLLGFAGPLQASTFTTTVSSTPTFDPTNFLTAFKLGGIAGCAMNPGVRTYALQPIRTISAGATTLYSHWI